MQFVSVHNLQNVLHHVARVRIRLGLGFAVAMTPIKIICATRNSALPTKNS